MKTFSVLLSMHHSRCFRLSLVWSHKLRVKDDSEKSICLSLRSHLAFKCFLSDLIKADSANYPWLRLKQTEIPPLTVLWRTNVDFWQQSQFPKNQMWAVRRNLIARNPLRCVLMSSVNQSQTTGSILDTIWIPGMTGHMNHRHTEDFKAYDLEILSRELDLFWTLSCCLFWFIDNIIMLFLERNPLDLRLDTVIVPSFHCYHQKE